MRTNSLLTRATCDTLLSNEDELFIRSVPRKNREKNQGRTEKKFSEGLQEKFILYFCHRKLTNTNKKTIKYLRYRHSVFIEGIFYFLTS